MHRPAARLALPIALSLTLFAARSLAQANAPEPDETPGLTPRAALVQFLGAARAGDFTTAGRFMSHPDRAMPDRNALARDLRAVLDRQLWIDPPTLSDRPEGRLDDGLAPHLEEIGRIRTQDGTEPVRLVRLNSGQWVFGRETLARVPVWYANLPNRWLYEKLPEPLLRAGPYDLAWWQWFALPVSVFLALAVGRAVAYVLQALLLFLARRTVSTLDDELIARLRKPRNLTMASLAFLVLIPLLHLPPRAAATAHRVTLAILGAALAWGLLRSVDLGTTVAARSEFASARPALRALLPLGSKIGKIVVFAISVVMLLQWLGLPVASLIAGLGIGGLAVALAAKTTIENLIASVTLGVDQPFRPGDVVKIDDTVGTVESVGLRSTRVRTLDRTLVSLPNGKVADMRIESYTARDRMRLATVLGLVYGTTATQMRVILGGIEAVLLGYEKVWPDEMIVRFKALGDSALEVEVMAWFQTTDPAEFGAIRQNVLLDFMAVVEKSGSSFAFPTRTVHVVNALAPGAGESSGEVRT